MLQGRRGAAGRCRGAGSESIETWAEGGREAHGIRVAAVGVHGRSGRRTTIDSYSDMGMWPKSGRGGAKERGKEGGSKTRGGEQDDDPAVPKSMGSRS